MTETVEKRERGRPAVTLSEDLAALILQLAGLGKTDVEIADEVGIGITTLKKLKGAHPDFAAAIKDAKTVADRLVEGSLFEQALAGSTTAAIFWLKNRQPEKWRDVHKIDVTGEIKLVLPTLQEAKRILEADYAMLPAPEVKVDDI